MIRNVGHALALRNFIASRGSSSCRTTSTSFSTSQRTNSALSISQDAREADIRSKAQWMSEYKEREQKRKMDDLLDSIGRDRPNPSRTWGYYINVLQDVGVDKIPIEVHRATLRKCVPSSKQLRIATARRMQTGNFPTIPHLYESRLRQVVSNIRKAGASLETEDYHFILEQYAAVGFYLGALQLLKDMERVGAERKTRTFALCLQAVAHRLSLPYSGEDELDIRTDCSDVCSEILGLMTAAGKEITPVILDFVLRIIKDSRDVEAFDILLKSAYGIDLSYPDHYALQKNPEKYFHPISTSTLTTIVDFFGREGLLSKMILAFEVLSHPLPHPSSIYDEEEEDYVPSIGTPPLPSAEPNASTYIAMIRRSAFGKKPTVARHYFLEAMAKDREHDARLRRDLSRPHPVEVSNPTVSISRAAFVPILGFANRAGDIVLMRWLLHINKQVVQQKRADIEYYSALLRERQMQNELLRVSDDYAGITEPNAETSSSFFTPNPHDATLDVHVLDVDLEAKIPSPPPRKRFDLNIHIDLLQRDLADLLALDETLSDAYARLCNRGREALDRRVEKGSGIFLRHEHDRVVMDKDQWKEIRETGPTDFIRNTDTGTLS